MVHDGIPGRPKYGPPNKQFYDDRLVTYLTVNTVGNLGGESPTRGSNGPFQVVITYKLDQILLVSHYDISNCSNLHIIIIITGVKELRFVQVLAM